MQSMKKIIILSLSFIIISCTFQKINIINKTDENVKILHESKIIQIPLSGKISQRNSEISGLCWYGDKLIILPQYPDKFVAGFGKIFYITKHKLEKFINGEDSSKIKPDYFSINLSGFEDLFSFGSGFEAITIMDDTAFFSIENLNYGKTETILIKGQIDRTKKEIFLNKEHLAKNPTNLSIHNISDESILSYENKIIQIYEVYGKNINNNPEVSVFNTKLEFRNKLKFPSIEYRLTDVTSVDEFGKFWAINYFYPGDNQKLNPAKDLLLEKFGIGKSHFNADPIERLVEFQILKNEIILVENAPVYIELLEGESRNWEGIARFKDGFLIATDTFPETILAFVSKK
jgi:hypothetical protein